MSTKLEMYYWFVINSVVILVGIIYGDTSDGDRIIGGRFAKKGEFPYVVLISFRAFSSSCGGGILSPLYVLTACHCTSIAIEPYGERPQRINGDYENTRVIAGTISRDAPHEQGYQLRWVYQWMQHPNCEPLPTGEWIYDIAVIQVAARFIFNDLVQPLHIPPTQLQLKEIIKTFQVIEQTCWIAGFGYTSVDQYEIYSDASKYLKALLTRLLPPHSCNSLLCDLSRFENCVENYNYHETPDRVCAAAKYKKSGSTCIGDSGGPLVCAGVSVAVVSYTSRCSALDDPVVYARIDTAFDFISKYYMYSSNYVGD